MKNLIVVAFGGNALLRPGQRGTALEQIQNVWDTCNNLVPILKEYQLVITHGNGPQVGNILLQNQAGAQLHNIPEMPLDICGAFSQGFIGYIIEQQLLRVLHQNQIERKVATLITQVLVDKNDPAFDKPTKPIGPYYTKEQAEQIAKQTGSVFHEDPKGNGWRKVVASPTPKHIINKEIIEQLAKEGKIVIAVGGGGIPVYYEEKGTLKGIEAVIDKDLASALLATEIGASELYILTDVPHVCINFRKPDEKKLRQISIAEAKKYLAEGHFAEGSMAPKIKAAINFIENGGKKCIITSADSLNNPEAGTEITY